MKPSGSVGLCNCKSEVRECLSFLRLSLSLSFPCLEKGMWDLSSQTRDQTHSPPHWKHKVLTTGMPGKSENAYLNKDCLSHALMEVREGDLGLFEDELQPEVKASSVSWRQTEAWQNDLYGWSKGSELVLGDRLRKLPGVRWWKTFVSVCSAAQLCLILCDPMDCSPLCSSVCGITQAKILEWVVFSSSRGSPWSRNQTVSPGLTGGFFTTEPPGKPWMTFVAMVKLWLLLEWERSLWKVFHKRSHVVWLWTELLRLFSSET